MKQDEEEEEDPNEDTAYTNKYKSRTGGSRGRHIGQSRFTEGVNYDEIREEDLNSEDS